LEYRMSVEKELSQLNEMIAKLNTKQTMLEKAITDVDVIINED